MVCKSNVPRNPSRKKKIRKLTSYYGYFKVTLFDFDLKCKLHAVHRLVAIAFIDNPHNKPFVNHINCIKSDNRLENLEWCTPKENMQHACKNNLFPCREGEKNTLAKLTDEKVLKIFNSKEIQFDIANKYKVSQSSICQIKSGKTWSHVTRKVYSKGRKQKIQE